MTRSETAFPARAYADERTTARVYVLDETVHVYFTAGRVETVLRLTPAELAELRDAISAALATPAQEAA